jgi:hypothetical protein
MKADPKILFEGRVLDLDAARPFTEEQLRTFTLIYCSKTYDMSPLECVADARAGRLGKKDR